MGRYQETPVKKLAELRSGQYVSLGDPDDAEVRVAGEGPDWKPVLRMILENQDGWATFKQLQTALKDANAGKGCRMADLVAAVSGWFEGGELEREGDGKSADPYRFRAVK
jgi:hypothetical protein